LSWELEDISSWRSELAATTKIEKPLDSQLRLEQPWLARATSQALEIYKQAGQTNMALLDEAAKAPRRSNRQ